MKRSWFRINLFSFFMAVTLIAILVIVGLKYFLHEEEIAVLNYEHASWQVGQETIDGFFGFSKLGLPGEISIMVLQRSNRKPKESVKFPDWLEVQILESNLGHQHISFYVNQQRILTKPGKVVVVLGNENEALQVREIPGSVFEPLQNGLTFEWFDHHELFRLVEKQFKTKGDRK